VTAYQVTLGDRVVRVTVRRTDTSTFVRVDDGDEREVALAHLRGAHYSLALGQARTEVLARATAESVSMAIAGLEFRADVVDEAHARLASVAGARSASHTHLELKAPMPGLLVRVLCQPGDAIEPGQPLAVLQAMKMENELSFPRGGTVSTVNAQPGQTVEQGQVLIVLE